MKKKTSTTRKTKALNKADVSFSCQPKKYKIELRFFNNVPYTNYEPQFVNTLNRTIYFPECGAKRTDELVEGLVTAVVINGSAYKQNLNVSNLIQPYFKKGALYNVKKHGTPIGN